MFHLNKTCMTSAPVENIPVIADENRGRDPQPSIRHREPKLEISIKFLPLELGKLYRRVG